LVKLVVAFLVFLFLQTVIAQLPRMAVADVQVRVTARARRTTPEEVLVADAQPFVFLDLQLIW
jgi:hypothetical protein